MLVHGFLDFGYGWHEVADRLAAHTHHVIAPDMRGHGDTDWIGPGGYYHFLDYIADLDEVIARTARKRLVLVGHSMGGSIASYWAGMRPTRLHALALLEGLGPPDQSEVQLPHRTELWIDAWRKARSKQKPMTSLDEAVARLRKHDPQLNEDLARRLATHGTREREGGGLVFKHDPLHATMGPYPFRRDFAAQYWKRITCPVLIVDGGETKLNLPDPERAARRALFANHRHVVVPGVGHMMQRHDPDAITRLLLELV